jgi:hypothetical protein
MAYEELTTKQKVERIVDMRKALLAELAAIQKTCPHDNKTGRYGSDTGNYDSSNDYYWINAHCEDCDRTWSIYNDEDGYRGFTGRIE